MTTKPVYFTGTWVVPAAAGGVNGVQQLNIAGNFVRCFSSSIAGTPFYMQIDDGGLGQMDQGVAAYAAPGDVFSKITLENASAAAITVTMAWGFGDLLDSRLSVTGIVSENLSEVNGNAVATGNGVSGGGTQRVNIASDNSRVATYVTDQDGHEGPREGANVFGLSSGGAGVTTIVAPATNVNGMWLRTANILNAANGVAHGAFYGDTAAPTGVTDYSKRRLLASLSATYGDKVLPFPLYLPAGVGLYFAASVANIIADATYEVM